MIDDDVIDDQQTPRVRRRGKMLQIREAAPMRVHLVKIAARIAVELPAAIEHHRRNPDRRRSQRLDVIQFLLNSLEITPVHRSGAAGVVIPVGVVVRRIAIKKAVGDDLVNALGLPEPVGNGLGGNWRGDAQTDAYNA